MKRCHENVFNLHLNRSKTPLSILLPRAIRKINNESLATNHCLTSTSPKNLLRNCSSSARSSATSIAYCTASSMFAIGSKLSSYGAKSPRANTKLSSEAYDKHSESFYEETCVSSCSELNIISLYSRIFS